MTTTTRTTKATLEYRRPAPVDNAKLALTAAVRHREAAYQGAALTMFAVALPALLFGPLLVAGIATGIQHRWSPHHAVAFLPTLLITSAVLIPSLFWFERRTQGRWFENELRRQGTTPADLWQCSSRGEWELRSTAAGWAGLIEIMLWAPRMLTSAIDRWRHSVSPNVLAEAASILAYLRHFSGGVRVDELPTLQHMPVLRYLVSRDWVGVSSKGDRVWLLQDARKTLGFADRQA
jgi:hypothetical protein